MVFIGLTRLRIRAWHFMPGFLTDTVKTAAQVRWSGGYITGALLADRKRTFWTMTAWQDQAAMKHYITTGSHLKAMPKLLGWCDEASIAYWTQGQTTLPDWTEADRRMRAEGRPSKVRHPSAHHLDMSFAPPRRHTSLPLKPATKSN